VEEEVCAECGCNVVEYKDSIATGARFDELKKENWPCELAPKKKKKKKKKKKTTHTPPPHQTHTPTPQKKKNTGKQKKPHTTKTHPS